MHLELKLEQDKGDKEIMGDVTTWKVWLFKWNSSKCKLGVYEYGSFQITKGMIVNMFKEFLNPR